MAAIAGNAVRTRNRAIARIWGSSYRGRMAALMLVADLMGLGMGIGLVLLANQIRHFMTLEVRDAEYLIIPLMCLIQFMSSRLYPCVGVSPPDEIKMVTQFTSTSFGLGVVFFSFLRPHWTMNIAAFAAAWGFSILAVLVSRWAVRIVAAQLGLWGEPAVVLAHGAQAGEVACYFCRRRRLGFVPVLVSPGAAGTKCDEGCKVPVMGMQDILNSEEARFSRQGIQTVMVDFSTAAGAYGSGSMKDMLRLFKRVIFVSDAGWLEGASMRIKDFEGIVGIAAQKNVLSPVDAVLKRGLDIVGAVLPGVVLMPLWLAIAMLIKLDSPGTIFYSHKRVGKGGRTIRIYKFRTMVMDADLALEGYLAQHPEQRREWEQTHKLREDPRITRIGRLLRRYSIDEIPQLLNVVTGDLSLVGPRPIVEAERWRYAQEIDIYMSTSPGMTGLWQVSGRNNTSYHDRVRFDTYYVRNWTLWLDIYVLLRTVWVVCTRDGAY